MCFTYDEYAEVYNETVRTARKYHGCLGCRRGIQKGQRYVDASGIFDCEPFSYRVCGACELDRYRIHIGELGEGCRWNTSWCPTDELGEYRHWNPEIERATVEEGQQYLEYRQRRSEGYSVAFSELFEKRRLA